MALEILKWIDRDLKEITTTDLFKKYFSNKEFTKDENDFYLSNEDKGISLVLSNEFIITTVHLFSGEYLNAKQFKDELPFDVKFSFTRADIKEKFGPSSKSGGGHMAIGIGYIPIWDKYFFEGFSLHFRYSKDNDTIQMITIASLKLEEYFNTILQ